MISKASCVCCTGVSSLFLSAGATHLRPLHGACMRHACRPDLLLVLVYDCLVYLLSFCPWFVYALFVLFICVYCFIHCLPAGLTAPRRLTTRCSRGGPARCTPRTAARPAPRRPPPPAGWQATVPRYGNKVLTDRQSYNICESDAPSPNHDVPMHDRSKQKVRDRICELFGCFLQRRDKEPRDDIRNPSRAPLPLPHLLHARSGHGSFGSPASTRLI